MDKNSLYKIGFWSFTILVTYLTLSPIDDIKPSFWNLNIKDIDKVMHFGIFLVFTYLFHLAYKIPTLWILVISIFYGLLIEILQETFGYGRSFDWWDFAFDSLGVVSGSYLFFEWKDLIKL